MTKKKSHYHARKEDLSMTVEKTKYPIEYLAIQDQKH